MGHSRSQERGALLQKATDPLNQRYEYAYDKPGASITNPEIMLLWLKIGVHLKPDAEEGCPEFRHRSERRRPARRVHDLES